MKMSSFCSIMFLSISVVLAVASLTFAAPSLDITKGPVTPNPSWTGPVHDSHALQGQWFLDKETGLEEVRPYEFYDNVTGFGGGQSSSSAILGLIENIQYDAVNVTNIVAFDIRATITNDTPGVGDWRPGDNSHGERLNTNLQYTGTLYDTKLTTEFAVDMPSLTNWLGTGGCFSPPYTSTDPFITADAPDELGWYCWTPGSEQQPSGDYLVPTYDFGDILPGQSVTRVLSFKVSGDGLTPGDPRYEVFFMEEGQDVFLNRTTSLKISNWVEMLGIDDGTPYPADNTSINIPMLNSDVSVFQWKR